MDFMKNYIILRKIGSGSYSVVYKAHHKDDKNKLLAIKVVEKSKLSLTGKDNIITEIQMMKLLKHKHIITMEDFSWDDKNIYIGLEYCGRGDLSNFIRRKRKLQENTCREFLQQLAVGLQFLRSHNISHLDLKPQNLLLTKPDLILKISDFGFAQYLSDSAQQNSIRGSPLYMAPEILLGFKYDARADLWSVGIITYECLFGKSPYSSNTWNALFKNATDKVPIMIPDNISNECQHFLTGLLQQNVEKRMAYEEFFSHPFLNLEYYPSEVSYQKAVKIVTMAVEFDKQLRYSEACDCYNKALLYILPLASAECDKDKRNLLYDKIKEYTSRASTIQNKIKPNSLPTVSDQRCVTEYAFSKDTQLLSLCSTSPSLKTAVEIAITAEMYFTEGQYQLSLEKFQACLNLLVPTLSLEPPGLRKEMLHKLIQKWLKQAETAKENAIATTPSNTKEACCVQ